MATPAPAPAAAARRRLLFGELFFGLRDAGIPIGLGDWMALMRALAAGLVRPDLADFYAVARALLVKHEAHYDLWDQVFAAVFAGGTFPKKVQDELLAWLDSPLPLPDLSEDELAALERHALERLRELFEERRREQDERHDGGNRWIGTGGTSPFGHGGRNPAGVRVGGPGGGKSAVQVAMERRFADYRSDRLLDTRQIAVALRRLRRLSRTDGDLELDVEESIDETCRNAGFLSLAFRPPRKNQARVLLLMDVGGSMTPYTRLVETLFSAAKNLHHWKKLEPLFFHNCVYSRVFESMSGSKTLPTAELLQERPKDTFLIFVGDASMAPSELLSPHGAIDYFEHGETPGFVWLHRLRARFERAIWLNPLPPEHWRGYTTELIGGLIPMFPLSLAGITAGIDRLLKRAPAPVPELDESLLRGHW